MTDKIPTPEETQPEIDTPEGARQYYHTNNVLKRRIIEDLRKGLRCFTVEDLLYPDFPPMYYAKSKYYSTYLKYVEGMIPDF